MDNSVHAAWLICEAHYAKDQTSNVVFNVRGWVSQKDLIKVVVKIIFLDLLVNTGLLKFQFQPAPGFKLDLSLLFV